MKENVSGYPCNLCFLKREQDAAFPAKLLALLTGILQQKTEELMVRSPVLE